METWKVVKEYNIKDFQHVWPNTTHLQHPTISPFGKGSINVLVGVRDSENRSRIRQFTLDHSFDIHSITPEPLIELGGLGEFDEYGQMPSCVEVGQPANRLWYIGITRGTVPYKNSIGVARIEKFDEYVYTRLNFPILAQGYDIPYFATCPWIDRYTNEDAKITFVTGTGYIEENGKIDASYDVVQAHYNPQRFNVSSDYYSIENYKKEAKKHYRSIARPVIYKNRIYFSSRFGKNDYKLRSIAYDGTVYNWLDSAEINFKNLPDSANEMQCYPMPFEFMKKDYMFFNGNNFGKETLLLAVKE